MTNQKRLHDLSDLGQLLSPSDHSEGKEPLSKAAKVEHDGKGSKVHVGIDRAGRKGKTVTVISGLQHNPSTMNEIARILKQHCGAGGTVRGMDIEIQGDQRNRVTEILQQMNYDVT